MIQICLNGFERYTGGMRLLFARSILQPLSPP